MAHIGFYFTNHKNKTIELPIAPAGFTAPIEFDNQTDTVIKQGEVNRIGERKLVTLPVEGTLPFVTKNSNLITAKSTMAKAADYINFFKDWQNSKKPGRFVVTGVGLNYPVTVEKFNHKMADGNDAEFVFSLEVKEWRNYEAKKLKVNKPNPKQAPKRPAPPKKIGIGSTVIANGRLHRDSWGAGPGQTERNAKRKVNFINKGKKCPYHVTDLRGGWRGWMKASDVRGI